MTGGVRMSDTVRTLVKEHYPALSHLGGPRTPLRVAVLAELRSNGSMRKSELRRLFVDGEFGEKDGTGEENKVGGDWDGWGFTVSKPTLYRQFDKEGTGDALSLVERGWVEDVSEHRSAEARYAITPKGRLVCERLESLFSTFDLMEDVQPELEPFLEVVTKSDMEMEADVIEELTDAEIYAATPTNLYGVFSEYMEFIADVEHIRGISWVSSELFVESYYKFLVDENKTVELILSPTVLEQLVEKHAEEWSVMLETGNLTVIESNVFPFGMTVVEHGVAWGYFEPKKGAHEYELITESDVVRDWATDVLDQYKEEGRNVTDEQLEEVRKRTSE